MLLSGRHVVGMFCRAQVHECSCTNTSSSLSMNTWHAHLQLQVCSDHPTPRITRSMGSLEGTAAGVKSGYSSPMSAAYVAYRASKAALNMGRQYSALMCCASTYIACVSIASNEAVTALAGHHLAQPAGGTSLHPSIHSRCRGVDHGWRSGLGGVHSGECDQASCIMQY
jgi:hypothetical protein